MKKKLSSLSLILICTLLFTGCGNQIPDMTDQQSALITEYAAGLLLEYDKNHVSRLTDTTAGAEETATGEDASAQTQVPAATDSTTGTDATGTATNTTTNAQTDNNASTIVNVDIAQFMGLTGCSIQYVNYEVVDSYPNPVNNNATLMIEPQTGAKLVAFNFNITNNTSAAETIDINSKNATFDIVINGTSDFLTINKIIVNGMDTFSGNVDAGASQNVVLIMEVDAATAAAIQSADLNMSYDGLNATTTLF